MNSSSTIRLGVRLFLLAVLGGLVAGPAAALSEFASAWNSTYRSKNASGYNIPCSYCHERATPSRNNPVAPQNDTWEFTNYGNSLRDQGINADSRSEDPESTPEQAISAYLAIEGDYSPEFLEASANGSPVDLDAVPRGTPSLTMEFDPVRRDDSDMPGLSSEKMQSISWPSAGGVPASLPGSASGIVDIDGLDPDDYTINVTTISNRGYTEKFAFSFTITNASPRVTSNPTYTREDTVASFSRNLENFVTDGNGDDLTFDLTNVAFDRSLDGIDPEDTVALRGSRLTFFPSLLDDSLFEGESVDIEVTYTVSDGIASRTGTVTLTVNGSGIDFADLVANDDTFPTLEDETLSGADVLDNDDLDGLSAGDLVITFDTDGISEDQGVVTDDGNGVFSFEPTLNFFGSVKFDYTIKEDGGEPRTASVTVEVASQNDKPKVQDPPVVEYFTTEPPIERDLLAPSIVTDEDGDTLTVRNFSVAFENPPPSVASVSEADVVQRNGSRITITPSVLSAMTEAERTNVIVTYGVDDGAAPQVPVRLEFTVRGVAPEAAELSARSDLFTILEDGGAIEGNVLADNGNGPDELDGLSADEITVAFDGPDFVDTGSFAALGGDAFRFTPAKDFNGEVAFGYTISDGVTTSRATVTITVEAVNDAPKVRPILLGPLEVGDAPLQQNLLDPALVSDVDDEDTLQAAFIDVEVTKPNSVVDVADGQIVSVAGGRVTIDPGVLDGMAPGEVTDVLVSYSVDDDSGEPPVDNSLRVQIVAPSDGIRQLVARDDAFSLQEDDTLVGENVLNDNGKGPDELDGLDRDDIAVVFDEPSDGTLTLGETPGSFSYTPAENFTGTATIGYTLVAGVSRSSATVTVTVSGVNDVVSLTPISLGSRTESDPVFSWDLLLRDNAPETPIVDPDGDRLTVTIRDIEVGFSPAGLEPAGFFEDEFVQVRGSIVTFTPRALDDLDVNEVADVRIDYTVSDGNGGDVSNTLSLRILGLDNSVIAQPGAYADTLASRYTSQPFGAHFRTQSSNPGSCLTCHQPESVNVDVNDCTSEIFNEFGLALCKRRIGGRGPLSDLVRRLNEVEADFAPRLDEQILFSLAEGARRGTPVGTVQATDPGRDVEGNQSEIVAWLITAEGARPSETDPSGNFTVDANGVIAVASDSLAPGTYQLGVVPVNDARQRTNAGEVVPGLRGFFLTQLTRANVIVEVVAQRPIAVADSVNTEQGAPVDINVIANDQGGSPTRIVVVEAAANGQTAVNTDNSVTYTPAGGFTGTDTFIYEASNALSDTPSSATVTVNVVGAGGLVARDDAVNAVRGAAVVIDVLANDGNAITSGSEPTVVQIESGPDDGVGTVRVVGQNVEFTPAEGAPDAVSFRYRASNGGAGGSSATVTVSVVSFAQGVIANAVRDPELVRVASAMDQSCALIAEQDVRSGDAEALFSHCTALGVAALSGEQLDGAMRAIRNEEHLAVVDMTSSIARGLGGAVSDRIGRVRDGGARGFDVSGVTVTMDGQTVPSNLLAQVGNGILGTQMSLQEQERYTMLEWGMFIGGDFSFNRRDADDRTNEYDFDVANVVVGLDYRRDPFTTLGVALGFSDGRTEFGDGSSIDAKGYQATLYAVQRSWNRPGLSYEGYLSLGRTEYDSDRKIVYALSSSSVDTAAQANFHGEYANLTARLNYSQILGSEDNALSDPIAGLVITYYVSLDYLWFRTDDYTERNGDGLALSVESEIYRSMIADIGVDFRRPIFLYSGFTSEAYGGFAIGGELLDEKRSVTSSFAAVGSGAPSFTVTEDGANGMRGSVDIGLMTSSRFGDFDVGYGYTQDVRGFEGHDVRFQFSRSFIGRDRLGLSLARNVTDPASLDASIDYRLDF